MILAAVIGALIGGVVFVLVLRVAPPRTSPLVELARLDARHSPRAATAPLSSSGGPAVGWAPAARTRVGSWVVAQLHRRGVEYRRLRQDLALTGQTLEQLMGRKVTLSAAGLLLGVLGGAALSAAGIGLPAGATVILAVGFAVVFFLLPDLEVRREAAARREEFHRALGAYLDLVALEMAGSAAPAEALPSAAKVGAGWPLALIRDTLFRATRAGTSPWAALADLGDRIGVSELRDLGQLIDLVAHDGARVRSTLTARAQTMRRHELADLEGKAGKADQNMRIAQILIGMGFIVFLGYPAVMAVLAF